MLIGKKLRYLKITLRSSLPDLWATITLSIPHIAGKLSMALQEPVPKRKTYSSDYYIQVGIWHIIY